MEAGDPYGGGLSVASCLLFAFFSVKKKLCINSFTPAFTGAFFYLLISVTIISGLFLLDKRILYVG